MNVILVHVNFTYTKSIYPNQTLVHWVFLTLLGVSYKIHVGWGLGRPYILCVCKHVLPPRWIHSEMMCTLLANRCTMLVSTINPLSTLCIYRFHY